MSENFQVPVHQEDGSLHLKLVGEFNGRPGGPFAGSNRRNCHGTGTIGKGYRKTHRSFRA